MGVLSTVECKFSEDVEAASRGLCPRVSYCCHLRSVECVRPGGICPWSSSEKDSVSPQRPKEPLTTFVDAS